jgi:deoxycytidine triphosphate deaminase/cell division protein FtsB
MSDVHPLKYVDPEGKNPGRKGMLLSNEIVKFRERSLLISEGFEEKNLRPAAYTLRIGKEYVDSNGRRDRLDDNGQSYFMMEPNSIVYVSTFEKLDLPCYVAARFNLRVKWVYRGILLGTGPQVEPGYRGYLSCPLYNLTDRRIKIEYKQDFATIDFERTTDFCEGASFEQIRDAIRHDEGKEFPHVTWLGEDYLLFTKEYPPLKLLPEHDVISSLFELSREVRTWRHIEIGFTVSFFALTLTLLSFGAGAYRQANDLAIQVSALRSDLRDAQRNAQQLEQELRVLKEKVAVLENQPKATPDKGIKGSSKRQ